MRFNLRAHTPDSVIVFVNLPSGKRFAFVGDLTFQKEGIDIPAHDLAAFGVIPKFPAVAH